MKERLFPPDVMANIFTEALASDASSYVVCTIVVNDYDNCKMSMRNIQDNYLVCRTLAQ